MKLFDVSGKRPILSIIVPIHKNELHFKELLDSIDYQKLGKSVEVLIIDDQEDHNIEKISQKYTNLYPEIIFYCKTPVYKLYSKANAINYGVKISRGYYIKVISHDDTFDKTNLVLFVHSLAAQLTNKQKYDVILTNYYLQYGDNRDRNDMDFSPVKGGILGNIHINQDTQVINDFNLTILRDVFTRFNDLPYYASITDILFCEEIMVRANNFFTFPHDFALVNANYNHKKIINFIHFVHDDFKEYKNTLLELIKISKHAKGKDSYKMKHCSSFIKAFSYYTLLHIANSSDSSTKKNDNLKNICNIHIKAFNHKTDFKWIYEFAKDAKQIAKTDFEPKLVNSTIIKTLGLTVIFN